jgi:uncharacterized protein
VTTSHTLDPDVFDRLAAGGGGPTAIEQLSVAQYSKHLLLITCLLEQWPPARRDALVNTLERSRQRDPAAFRTVLGAPLVGAWAAIANRAVGAGSVAASDLDHLDALATVAAAAATVDTTAPVPTRDDTVAVPGWGAATVPAGASARLIAHDGRLTVHSGQTLIEVAGTDGPGWQAVRQLVGENPLVRLGLDDLDPYRHGHHLPPAARLAAAEFARWQELFADAWRLLAERLPDRAAELGAGLRTLVPLAPSAGTAASATIRHAFGIFGLTRPTSAADFAVTLVHEFQHSKLSAILDLMPLSDPDDQGRYFAPWRTDPRPLSGLIQGVYAFVGVADTWRALREVDAIAPTAQAQFAQARLQVDRGLSAVEGSGALTAAGTVLVTRLRHTTDALLAEAVPVAVEREAELDLARTRQRWESRNGAA